MIRRLLCWLGLHVPPAGVDPRWSIFWVCTCGKRIPGGVNVRRRR